MIQHRLTLLLGNLCSGKTTLANWYDSKPECNVLRLGELFLKEIKQETELGKQLKLTLPHAKPVLDTDELKEFIFQKILACQKSEIIIDTFPFNLIQLIWLCEFLDQHEEYFLYKIVIIPVEESEARARCKKRNRYDRPFFSKRWKKWQKNFNHMLPSLKVLHSQDQPILFIFNGYTNSKESINLIPWQ